MPFFTQKQNNSGGRFIGPQIVIIEADTEEKAIKKFKSKKRRFREDAKFWCRCCGERWNMDGSMDNKHDTLEEAMTFLDFFGSEDDNYGLVFMKDKEVYVFGPGDKCSFGRKCNFDSLTVIDKNDTRVTGV